MPKPARAVAPWVRTRLRTAPAAALAFGLLVLATSFLAAALPRSIDAYETDGLRQSLAGAPPHQTAMTLTTSVAADLPLVARKDALRPEGLRRTRDKLLPLLPKEVGVDPDDSVYGVRTPQRLQGLDPWLPKPYGLPAEFVLTAPSDLSKHATLISGRAARAVAGGGALEAVVTPATAKDLKLKTGSVIHVPGSDGEPKTITITGLIKPQGIEHGYWSVDPLLHTPGLTPKQTPYGPIYYWQAALIVPPEAAPDLFDTATEPQVYWQFTPTVGHLASQDTEPLIASLASASGGPGLVKLRQEIGPPGEFSTQMDDVLAGYVSSRDAIGPVVAVAAFGIGAVAAVVIAMTGGLFAVRRHAELSLLRSRGASMTGLGVRLFGETTVVVVPTAALGLLLALLTVGADSAARFLPACLASVAVAVLGSAVLPLRALWLHRRPLLHGGRSDVIAVKPSRGRTIAELTVLVLAVGAVTALRRRGATDSGDFLVSAAPVLVGLIAALVLVRLYPLLLRGAARPAARLRGAVGYLSLARAGRSSAAGTLPLLALLLALTTAAFGGSVLAGVADARDRAALLATGADARVHGPLEGDALPAGLAEAVRGTAGVRDVTPVQIEYGLLVPSHNDSPTGPKSAPLVGVEPESYARLAARTGFGPFPAGLLAPKGGKSSVTDSSRVLPAIASPAVAERLGDKPVPIAAAAGWFQVKVVAVRDSTPALPGKDFLLVDAAGLSHRADTTLLVTGGSGGTLDAKALRATVQAKGKDFRVQLREERRATYVDSPLQSGAELIYAGAIGAGAGYAVLAVLLSLLQTAPERTTLLARLRTMGLTRAQGRRLLVLEALPQAGLAAVGGVLVGWATILLLSDGVDLARLALAAAPGDATASGATLRADLWSLGLPALGVVLITAGAAGVQAWWAARKGSVKELRVGDTR